MLNDNLNKNKVESVPFPQKLELLVRSPEHHQQDQAQYRLVDLLCCLGP